MKFFAMICAIVAANAIEIRTGVPCTYEWVDNICLPSPVGCTHEPADHDTC